MSASRHDGKLWVRHEDNKPGGRLLDLVDNVLWNRLIWVTVDECVLTRIEDLEGTLIEVKDVVLVALH